MLLVFRDTKGAPLTSAEGDANLRFLASTKLDILNTTQKVNGVNSSNLVINGSGELGMTGWNDPLNVIGASANLLGDGNTFNNAATFNANFTSSGQQIPIGPAVGVSVQAEIATLAMTQGAIGFRLDCYKADNTFISSIGTVSQAFATAISALFAVGTTPALTSYMIPVIYSTGVSGAQPALAFKVRRIKVEQGATPSLYSVEASVAGSLQKFNNLSDLPNKITARSNLNVGSVLLASIITTAAQGPIPFDGIFTTEFDSYEVVVAGLKANAASTLSFQFRRSGANAPITTAGYAYSGQSYAGAAITGIASNGDSTLVLINSASVPLSSSGVSGVIDIMAGQNITLNKSLVGSFFASGSANNNIVIGGRYYNDTLAVDGFALSFFGSSFQAGGTIKVYGRRA